MIDGSNCDWSIERYGFGEFLSNSTSTLFNPLSPPKNIFFCKFTVWLLIKYYCSTVCLQKSTKMYIKIRKFSFLLSITIIEHFDLCKRNFFTMPSPSWDKSLKFYFFSRSVQIICFNTWQAGEFYIKVYKGNVQRCFVNVLLYRYHTE